MSIQIHTATREESNNRAMLAPESKTKSGITLRAISLGSLEILRHRARFLSPAEVTGKKLSVVDVWVPAGFQFCACVAAAALLGRRGRGCVL